MLYTKVLMFAMLATTPFFAAAVPVPADVPVPSTVQGVAAASRHIDIATKPGSDKRKLQSTPTDAAAVVKTQIPSDMSSKIKDFCNAVVKNSCKGTQWHLKGDPEVKDHAPDQTWVQAHPDQLTWAGLDNPTVSETEIQVDCDNTDNSDEITCHASLSVQTGTTMTTSTTVASKVGVEFSVDASIPEGARQSM